jgi:hypothetical protein
VLETDAPNTTDVSCVDMKVCVITAAMPIPAAK